MSHKNIKDLKLLISNAHNSETYSNGNFTFDEPLYYNNVDELPPAITNFRHKFLDKPEVEVPRLVPVPYHDDDDTFNDEIYENTNSGGEVYDNLPLFVIELNERLELARKTLPSTSAAAAVQEDVHFAEPLPNETNDLVIGSMVEVLNDVSEEPLYGVVRWMGKEEGSNFVVAGVELEDEPVHLPLTLSDGTYKGRKLVECSGDRVLFVPITQCHKDSRFQDGIPTPVHTASEKTFGKVSLH